MKNSEIRNMFKENITYNDKTSLLNAFFNGKISVEDLFQTSLEQFNSPVADEEELQSFLRNKFTQEIMMDEYNISKDVLVDKVKELLDYIKNNRIELKEDKYKPIRDDDELSEIIREEIKSIMKESNYPNGAENDSNAPWNKKVDIRYGKTTKDKIFTVVYMNNEFVILKKNNSDNLYFFYYKSIDPERFEDYADIPIENINENGDEEYGEWDIDKETIENFANDNKLTIGHTYDDYERGNTDIVEINDEIKNDILSMWNDEELKNLFKN